MENRVLMTIFRPLAGAPATALDTPRTSETTAASEAATSNRLRRIISSSRARTIRCRSAPRAHGGRPRHRALLGVVKPCLDQHQVEDPRHPARVLEEVREVDL